MALPTVLAGPLLRRVEPQHVSVWVATSATAGVTLNVFQGSQSATGTGPTIATGTTQTRACGDQLHIAVVTADVTSALAPGSIYSYDLIVGGKSLRDLGLLRDATDDGTRQPNVDGHAPKHLALGYALDRLPSFATAGATVPDVKIVHTSCRKSNGEGPDALAWVDDEIQDHLLDPVQRPQQLFLTGDQIYADDVGACLLPLLNTLGNELIGFVEHVPIAGQDVEATIANFPALRRQRLMREIARLSSTEAANHLMTFAEWAAMYLLAFSPHAWRDVAGADEVFTAPPAQATDWHLTDWETAYNSVDGWRTHKDRHGDTTEAAFAKETARVQQWRDAVPKVARALANVPTYMICDDHEITDDWYLTKRWRSRALTAPLGHQLIRNGLMAYVAFQGWGNEPAAYSMQGTTSPPGRDLLAAIEAFAAERMPTSQGTRNSLDDLLGLTSPGAVPKLTFNYQVPGPRHLVRVLDTRTRRTYAGEGDSPPKLLGGTLDAQLPAGPLTDGRELLVVISAAPVLFPRLFDVLVQPVAATEFELQHHLFGEDDPRDPTAPGSTISGVEQWDLEGWHVDEGSHEAFLRRCGTYSRVVLLSGDVHFASSMVLDFWGKGDLVADSRIVQCTASAARNQPEPIMRAALRGMRFGQAMLAGVPFERLGWDGEPAISVPHGSSLRPGRRARLHRSPGIVRADGWPSGTTVDATKPPDWRWRLAALRDERPNPPRAASDTAAGTLPAFTADAIQSYANALGYQASMAFAASDPLRLMVFRNNIGVVTFTADGPDEFVISHEILSPVGAGTADGDRYTQHTVTTTRSALVAPQLRTV